VVIYKEQIKVDLVRIYLEIKTISFYLNTISEETRKNYRLNNDKEHPKCFRNEISRIH